MDTSDMFNGMIRSFDDPDVLEQWAKEYGHFNEPVVQERLRELRESMDAQHMSDDTYANKENYDQNQVEDSKTSKIVVSKLLFCLTFGI